MQSSRFTSLGIGHHGRLILLVFLGVIVWTNCWAVAEEKQSGTPVFRAGRDEIAGHFYTNFREPVVIRTNSGRLIIGVQAGNRLGWPERSGQDLVVRVSDDGGKTWGPLIVAAEHGNLSCQCHGLVYDAEINRVIFCYTVYNWDYKLVGKGRGAKYTKPIYAELAKKELPFVTSYRVHSDDEGKTWSTPTDITADVGRQAHFGASEGRQLTSGDRKGRLLIAGSRMDLDALGNVVLKHTGVWCSDDHGATWTLSEIPKGVDALGASRISSEARVSEIADGTLVYNQRTRDKGRQLAWSKDGGSTWTTSQRATELKVTQCNGCTITLKNESGKLTKTLLFSIPSPGGRSNGVVYASSDGGKTWGKMSSVVPGFFGYSALVQLDAVNVGLFHEANHYRDIRFVVLPIDSLTGENPDKSGE